MGTGRRGPSEDRQLEARKQVSLCSIVSQRGVVPGNKQARKKKGELKSFPTQGGKVLDEK